MAKLLRVITTSATDEIRTRNRPRKFRGDVKGTSPSRCVQVADSMDLIDSLGPVLGATEMCRSIFFGKNRPKCLFLQALRTQVSLRDLWAFRGVYELQR